MKNKRRVARKRRPLPSRLRQFFWDYDFRRLSWERDAVLITARILQVGDWQAITWLRRRLDNAALRAWILRRRGRGLSSRQLRFWELILELPKREVDAWIAAPAHRIWEGRRRA